MSSYAENKAWAKRYGLVSTQFNLPAHQKKRLEVYAKENHMSMTAVIVEQIKLLKLEVEPEPPINPSTRLEDML